MLINTPAACNVLMDASALRLDLRLDLSPLEQDDVDVSGQRAVSVIQASSRVAMKRSSLTGPQNRARKRVREFSWALLFLSPALAVFALFCYVPFFQAIWLSLHITNELGDPVQWIGGHYYLHILNLDGEGQNDYLLSLLTSCSYALMVVPLQILCGLGLAALAQANVRGIRIFRTIFTCSIAISLASASVIWSLIYDPTTNVTAWLVTLLRLPQPELLNNPATALPAIAVMTIWAGLGLNFVITLAGIQAIPEELFESARLDGAGAWNAFRYITLPLLSPILLFLLVVNTIQTFQAFTPFNVLINGPGPNSSTNVFVYALYQVLWFDHRFGFASAMSIVVFLILLALSALQLGVLGRRVPT